MGQHFCEGSAKQKIEHLNNFQHLTLAIFDRLQSLLKQYRYIFHFIPHKKIQMKITTNLFIHITDFHFTWEDQY